MNLDLAPGWHVELERGPDWLFVRLKGEPPFDAEGMDLAERVWRMVEQEGAHRVLIELDDIDLLRSPLLGELVRLHKRVASRDGIFRVSGLSQQNYDVLRSSGLHHRLPCYRNRADAVMGFRPTKPR